MRILLLTLLSSCVFAASLMVRGESIDLTPVKNLNSTSTENLLWYQMQNDQLVGVNNTIFLKLKKDQKLEELLTTYTLIVQKKIMDRLYLVQIDNRHNTIEPSEQTHKNHSKQLK
jgi:hypothetical protein